MPWLKTYQEQGKEPAESEQVGEDEACLLFRAIKTARHACAKSVASVGPLAGLLL